MKAAHVDRAFVLAVGTALTIWTACLVILWGWAFDTSGPSTMLTVAAAMMALSVSAVLPGRAAWAVALAQKWLHLGSAASSALVRRGPAGIGAKEAQAMLRLFGLVILLAVAGGAMSTVAIFGARALADRLGRAFLWAPLAWGGLKLLVQWLGLIPLAMGIALVLLTMALLRGGSGRDVFASACREWLTSVAAGLAGFAIAWLAGWNLLVVCLAAAATLVLLAFGLLLRRHGTTRPIRISPPLATLPQRRRELGVIVSFAVLAMTLLYQMRLLSDAEAICMPGRLAAVAGTLALLSGFLGRTDRHSRMPSIPQAAGSLVGVMAGLLLQSALAMAAVAAWPWNQRSVPAVAGVLALAAQGPMAAMAAVVLSRQRRLFAGTGGQTRTYLAAATMGIAFGILLHILLLSLPTGWLWLLIGVMALLAAGAIGGIVSTVQPGGQIRFAIWGVVLLAALSAAIVSGAPKTAAARFGVWLTSVSAAERPAVPRNLGYLPGPAVWRGTALGYTLDEAVLRQAKRGARRWWIVSGSDLDLSIKLLLDLPIALSFPDPTCVQSGGPGALVPGADAGFLQAAQTSRELFDGLVLAPMPVSHGDAWRCYNEQAIQRCRWRVHPSGLLVLRTQGGRGHAAALLAVARTFHEIVGPSWAAAQFDGDQMDLMLIGPASAMDGPPRAVGDLVHVVATERIWKSWSEFETIRLECPGALGYRDRPETAVVQWWFQRWQEPAFTPSVPPAEKDAPTMTPAP